MRGYLCSVSLGLLYVFLWLFLLVFDMIFVFSVLAKRLAGKRISDMTCFVSSEM